MIMHLLKYKMARKIAIEHIEAMILSFLRQLAGLPSSEDNISEYESDSDYDGDGIKPLHSSSESHGNFDLGYEDWSLKDKRRKIEIKLANRRKILPDGYFSYYVLCYVFHGFLYRSYGLRTLYMPKNSKEPNSKSFGKSIQKLSFIPFCERSAQRNLQES